MPKNVRDLLKQWYDEQYRIARTPSTGSKKVHNSAEESIAAERTKGDFDRTAIPDIAEARMTVISELRNFCNSDAVLSDTLENTIPADPKILPNNQERAVWTSVCSIAAIKPDTKASSWTKQHLRSMRIQRLAATINTCRG